MKLKRKKTRKRARRAQYASSVELLKEASRRLSFLRGNYEARVKSPGRERLRLPEVKARRATRARARRMGELTAFVSRSERRSPMFERALRDGQLQFITTLSASELDELETLFAKRKNR